MAEGRSIQIGEELYAAAEAAARISGRSAAEQVAHWASIGRRAELPLSPLEDSDIGTAYDELAPHEQEALRATWRMQIEDRRVSLDLESEFRRRLRPWSEAGPDGRVIIHRRPTD